MQSELYGSSKSAFQSQTGLNADENPLAYVEYLKLLAQEQVWKTLQDIRQELIGIKNKVD